MIRMMEDCWCLQWKRILVLVCCWQDHYHAIIMVGNFLIIIPAITLIVIIMTFINISVRQAVSVCLEASYRGRCRPVLNAWLNRLHRTIGQLACFRCHSSVFSCTLFTICNKVLKYVKISPIIRHTYTDK